MNQPDSSDVEFHVVPRWVRVLALTFCVPYLLLLNQYVLGSVVPHPDGVRPVNIMPFRIFNELMNGDGNFPHHAILLFGNVVLLMPIGITVALCVPRTPSWIGALLGVAAALAIEAYQYFAFTWRTADIDDVILNSLGFFCAFLAARHFLRLWASRTRTA